MARMTQDEARAIFNAKGYITRYRGYYMNVYSRKDERTWGYIGRVRCQAGTVTVKAVEAIA